MNGARVRRLAVLEGSRAQTNPPVAEWRAQAEETRQAAWEIMQSTMSEEHARLFIETYRAGLECGWDSIRGLLAGSLTRVCAGTLSGSYYRREPPYSAIPDEVRFAMPPEVADVYLTHNTFPDIALPLHDCEDCGFQVPILNVGGRCFERCPLCGGRFGWYAYFEKHREPT